MALTHFAQTIFHGISIPDDLLSFPTAKGAPIRIRGNLYYLTCISVTDPEEIKRREPLFRERLRPFIENFPKMWDQYRAEIEGYHKKLDAEDVTKLNDAELTTHFYEQMRVDARCWVIHFLLLGDPFPPHGGVLLSLYPVRGSVPGIGGTR